jgi:hypothetical protein
VGEMTKPTGGAHVAVTEGEGVIAGVRKLEEETAFGPDGLAGRWADWAESEGKILFRIKFDF